MTDTEARRLAEQICRDVARAPLTDVAKLSLDVGKAHDLARAYLNLLTRLETPGLTEDEQSVVLNACAGNVHSWDVPRLLAIISRLTQPTSTAGEGTLRTDTAHHDTPNKEPSSFGTGVGDESLPSVEPPATVDDEVEAIDVEAVGRKIFSSPYYKGSVDNARRDAHEVVALITGKKG